MAIFIPTSQHDLIQQDFFKFVFNFFVNVNIHYVDKIYKFGCSCSSNIIKGLKKCERHHIEQKIPKYT